MKKILLLLICASHAAFGQITLEQANFPSANESYVFSTLLDNSLDFSATGANFTWDFSMLVPTNQRGVINSPVSAAGQLSQLFFGNFALEQYKASYFNSSVDFPIDQFTANLPVSIDEIYLFTKNTPTYVNSVGYEIIFSGQAIATKSDTIETRYALPLTFGDTYTSRGYTDLDLNPIYDAQWRQHRYRQSAVDGYGTVTTPYGTFSSLRIHHIVEEIDSFYVSFNGVGTWVPIPIPQSHEYEWRSLDDKEAVMRIRTNVVAGNEQITAVEYRDEFNGLGLEANNLIMSVAPNPTVQDLTVTVSAPMKQLVVIDATGKVCIRQDTTGLSASISVESLSKGTYTIVVLTDSGVSSSKFVKQ